MVKNVETQEKEQNRTEAEPIQQVKEGDIPQDQKDDGRCEKMQNYWHYREKNILKILLQ